ncbi:MAG TPA: phage holin family protein [Gemmatimonadales bacterium]|nr:phage holin family protein [Gemmatimonadales bacterium]
MRGLLARTVVTAFGLWLADILLPGIRFSGAGPLFLAGLLLGVVNAFVRPIVIILTLPFTLVTLGFFLFVVNGAMILLVAEFMPSFHVAGLGTAILASIIVGLTGWLANGFIGSRAKMEIWKAKP